MAWVHPSTRATAQPPHGTASKTKSEATTSKNLLIAKPEAKDESGTTLTQDKEESNTSWIFQLSAENLNS